MGELISALKGILDLSQPSQNQKLIFKKLSK